MAAKICAACFSTERPQRYTKGWAWVLFIVGLFTIIFVFGFLLILMALFVGTGTRCRQCRSEALIPLNTPRGQQLIQQVAAFQLQQQAQHQAIAQLGNAGAYPARQ